MLKKIIIPLIMIFLLAAAARAQSGKEKVLFYNCSITFEKVMKPDAGKAARAEGYDYYSTIIPYTIARNLESTGKFDVHRLDELLPLEGAGSDLFYKRMQKLGVDNSAQYVIAGSVTVTGKKLAIDLFIINIGGRDFTLISRESFETGAVLRNITDDIAAEIGKQLDAYQKMHEKRVEESPFMKAYRVLDDFSFGVKAGKFFIKGPYSHIYENSDHISPYLFYGIVNWFGLSAEADFLNTDNGNKFVLKKTTMLLWGMTLNGNFTYWFFKNFGVRLSAGFGASIGRIYLNDSNNPFSGLETKKQSVDPYLNVSASFIILVKPIELQFGSSYKNDFFKGKQLQLITIFCGIGIHI